jgi:hypothetical protein
VDINFLCKKPGRLPVFIEEKSSFDRKRWYEGLWNLAGVTLLAVGLLAVWSKCMANDIPAEGAAQNVKIYTPKQFLAKSYQADLIVITAFVPLEERKIKPVVLKVCGGDVTNVLAVIQKFKSTRNEMNIVDCGYDMKMIFYMGTNQLASARVCDNIFLCDDGQFYDKSGVIEGIYRIYSQASKERYDSYYDKLMQNAISNRLNEENLRAK